MAVLMLCIFGAMAQDTPEDDHNLPVSGKFFFAQLFYERGQTYVEIGFGSPDPGQPIKLALSATELPVVVFSTECAGDTASPQCAVPNPYNKSSDTSFLEDDPVVNEIIDSRLRNDNGQLSSLTLTGTQFNTTLNITNAEYLRYFNQTIQSF